MVETYDADPPKTKEQIDAFIAHWQKKERADTTVKRSEIDIELAVRMINHRQIETIAKAKKDRDKRHVNQYCYRKKKLKKVVQAVDSVLRRNVIW